MTGMARLPRLIYLCTLTIAAFLSSPFGSARKAQADAGGTRAWSHAYYLFLSDPPAGCEACYVPLLITAAPLEEIATPSLNQAASRSASQDCVLVTTYERDSIWQLNGMVSVAAGDVQAAPRAIRVRGRNYRYQEVGAAEVVKLLKNPRGTIPISRPLLHSDLPPGPSPEVLIAAFERKEQAR
jgi:hypothetical protein